MITKLQLATAHSHALQLRGIEYADAITDAADVFAIDPDSDEFVELQSYPDSECSCNSCRIFSWDQER